MRAADIATEYRYALFATKTDDVRPLVEAGVSSQTMAAAAPAFCRIRVAGNTYEPDPYGGAAFLIPARVDNPVTPEARDPVEAIRSGEIVDILAFHPAYPRRWALRCDAAEWLGAIAPQFLDPPPIPVWRSPLAWLRAACRGLVVLSPEPADAYRILTACLGGIIAENRDHAAELRATLTRPWPLPPIIV